MTRRKISYIIKIFVFMAALLIPSLTITAASPLKIEYNDKEVDFKNQQVSVKLDGKTVYLDKSPGLELTNSAKEEIYMVSMIDVFQKAMGAECTRFGRDITISKYDITIKMKEDSKTAYVNGVKKTLPFAPTTVTYVKADKTKLLVPAKFLAEALGYQYTWKNNSKTSGTIYMTSPFCIQYDGKWHIYNQPMGNVTVYGEKVDVSDMRSVIIDGSALVQAKRVFADSAIGASYQYDSKTGKITIAKNETTIVMTLGSKQVLVNDIAVTTSAAPRLVKNGDTKKGFVMVPGQFVATKLGYHYTWNDSLKTSVITKKNMEYFNWSVGDHYVPLDDEGMPMIIPAPAATPIPTADPLLTPEPAAITPEPVALTQEPDYSITGDETIPANTPEPTPTPTSSPAPAPTPIPLSETQAPNYVSSMTGSFQDGKDIVSIKTKVTPVTKITKDNTNVYIKVMNVYGGIPNQTYQVADVLHLKGVSVSTENHITTITLNRISKADYTIQEGENTINIIFGADKIKIAIDCGHGANTPGKRTPPLPYDIDFEGDGIIDVRAGESINEHTADVGVANFLVEELERCGFDVYKSAFGAEDVPLSQRQANIKNAKADYSVSIHFNAIGDGRTFNSTTGTGVFYHQKYPSDSKAFSDTILKHLLKGSPQRSIGSNGSHSYAMCNTSVLGTKASVLIECAFMTNLDEVTNMMANSDYWKETAQEIAQAICEYTGTPYVK